MEERPRRRRKQLPPPERSLILDFLLLGGAGFVGWKLWQSYDSKEKEITGRPALWPLVVDAANQTNVPVPILAGVVKRESSWSNAPNSQSSRCKVNCIASTACAIGIAQVLPSTARDVGVTGDLCIPENSLIAGARYLRRLYDKYGDWRTTLVAYNWGPGNVDNAIKGGREFLSRSVDYATDVLASATDYNQGEALAGSRSFAGLAGLSLFRCRIS